MSIVNEAPGLNTTISKPREKLRYLHIQKILYRQIQGVSHQVGVWHLD
jgi:hypothetical protein